MEIQTNEQFQIKVAWKNVLDNCICSAEKIEIEGALNRVVDCRERKKQWNTEFKVKGGLVDEVTFPG